jgi:hypothetical protein
LSFQISSRTGLTEMNNYDYGAPPLPPSPDLQKLTLPAIGLIVTGGLNAITAILLLVSGLARLANNTTSTVHLDNDAQRLGYLVGTFVGYGAGVASILLAPVLIAGGIAMLRGKSLGLARAAAILAMIPVTSCCCVVGIPIGIWTLLILKKPAVEAYFRR